MHISLNDSFFVLEEYAMSAIWLAGHGLTQGEQSIDFPRPYRLVQGNPTAPDL